MNGDVQDIIDALELQPHPEGGFYRETWRSDRVLELDDYDGPRNAGTAIYFLLPTGAESRSHRVASDELWFWQGGDALELTIAEQTVELGPHNLQAIVPAGAWQSAKPVDGPLGYVLVSCVVVPGFDFADFEMA